MTALTISNSSDLEVLFNAGLTRKFMEYLRKPFSVINFGRILPLMNLQLKWCTQIRFCMHYCVCVCVCVYYMFSKQPQPGFTWRAL